VSRFLVLAGKGRKRCLDLKARSCSSFLPFLAEETGLGFARGVACSSRLWIRSCRCPRSWVHAGCGSVQPCHARDVEQITQRSGWFAGCAARAAASAPVWGKGRRFSAVVCRQVNAGGGLACQSAALPAKGLGREGLASHVETGTLQRGEGWGYARGR